MPRVGQAGAGLGDVMNRFKEIETLQGEVRRHLSAIEEIYARISRTAGKPASSGRRPGRPPGSRTRSGRRAKRGELKAAIHKILEGGEAVSPAEIVRMLPKVGFRSGSEPRVLYNTVYLSLTKDKALKKTSEGYQLRKGAK